MGWDRNARWNHDVLQSIVALLFALADLAERAAFCPARRRRHVLGIVGHGEAVARAFVMGIATEEPDAAESADDAARLAASLRALALMLGILLGRWFAASGKAGPRAGREASAGLAGCPAAPVSLDTS